MSKFILSKIIFYKIILSKFVYNYFVQVFPKLFYRNLSKMVLSKIILSKFIYNILSKFFGQIIFFQPQMVQIRQGNKMVLDQPVRKNKNNIILKYNNNIKNTPKELVPVPWSTTQMIARPIWVNLKYKSDKFFEQSWEHFWKYFCLKRFFEIFLKHFVLDLTGNPTASTSTPNRPTGWTTRDFLNMQMSPIQPPVQGNILAPQNSSKNP